MVNPPDFSIAYGRLPALFYHSAPLSPVAAPAWMLRNEELADAIGLDAAWFASDGALQALAGNTPLPGADPIAMAYSGHQFGGWSPLLGDGRALLAGEWRAPDGRRYDLHLKGSGTTAFSRNGDGRATLGAMLREYMLSEALAGLEIPTTRSLCVIGTGEPVYRRTTEPGAVLTRVARSHVRVGTFQLAATNRDVNALQALLRHELARNFPSLPDGDNPARFFLQEVAARQASLIAQWMGVGFIHGVMNTDNMQVAGETIDFGPCAFMDRFHPQKVFSSIDQFGRYAWDKQPTIALWNLTRLAESLLGLLHDDQDKAVELAREELGRFMPAFEVHFENLFRAKLGWPGVQDEDGEAIAVMFRHMMQGGADFTVFFRRLTEVAAGADEAVMTSVFASPEDAAAMLTHWRKRAGSAPDIAAMRAANPIRIARNHRVEEAIQAANGGDLSKAKRLVAALQSPFTEDPAFADLESPPSDGEEVRQTFCGT
jgi:uncharacterized protein YdiU (UPF0061 family)